VKETLQMINQMRDDGIIGEYAIGGAVGATFYLEPAATLDVDIFVVLPAAQGSSLVSLSPIYQYLKTRGGVVEHEHVLIGGWPVQFLPPSNELECEAITHAIAATVQEVPTRVMSAEHLVAIALCTGRAKDYVRIMQFIEQGAVEMSRLKQVLERHSLASKWKEFERKFLEGSHG
jgi:hypothetical protein